MLLLLYRNGALKIILRHRWRITTEGISFQAVRVSLCDRMLSL